MATTRRSLILPAPGAFLARSLRPGIPGPRTFAHLGAGPRGPARCSAGYPPPDARSYQEVPAVHVEHGAGDEGRRVGCQELVHADQVRRLAPAPERGVREHAGAELGVVLPRLDQR